MSKEYIEREAVKADLQESYEGLKNIYKVLKHDEERRIAEAQLAVITEAILRVKDAPAADVIEADRLGRVGRLMLPYKGCPRGPIGRLGMAGGKTQDKKAILIEELCCMDTFEDVDGNVWRPVQEEVLQEVIEILRKE